MPKIMDLIVPIVSVLDIEPHFWHFGGPGTLDGLLALRWSAVEDFNLVRLRRVRGSDACPLSTCKP